MIDVIKQQFKPGMALQEKEIREPLKKIEELHRQLHQAVKNIISLFIY